MQFRNQHGEGGEDIDEQEYNMIEQTVQASLKEFSGDDEWAVTKKKERKVKEPAPAVEVVEAAPAPAALPPVEEAPADEVAEVEEVEEPQEEAAAAEEEEEQGAEEEQEEADAEPAEEEEEDEKEDDEKEEEVEDQQEEDAEAPDENENQDDEKAEEEEEDEESSEVDEDAEDEDEEEQPAEDPASPQEQEEEEDEEEEEEDEGEGKPAPEEEEEDVEKLEIVVVPENKMGAVFGKGGQHLKMIQENTGVASIKKEDTGTFVIRGLSRSTKRAKDAIEDLMAKGYSRELYGGQDFKETVLEVEDSAIPNIVGPAWAFAKKIKEEKNVHLIVPESSRGKKEKKMVPITIAGAPKSVDDAEKIIQEIMEYSYSVFTHPGWTHEEIDTEPELRKFVIGKSGETINRIQEEFRVRVKFSSNGSKKTYVSGKQKKAVVAARDQIEKILEGKRPKEEVHADVEEEE